MKAVIGWIGAVVFISAIIAFPWLLLVLVVAGAFFAPSGGTKGGEPHGDI